MVAPYTLILTPNGSKKAWPPRKTPRKKGGGGEPFSGKGSGGDPNHTTAQRLWNFIVYNIL
jgi:hypothetical protein